MDLIEFLDKTHQHVVSNALLQRFAILNRILLAVAFIPTGLVKLKYERFSQIPTDNQIGFFFEAFYQNELWYMAVGFSQVLAGTLLLIPRTSHLGTFLFLPIIVNINLITFGAGFSGTPVVTGLMLLSNLYLAAWEYPYWRNWLTPDKNRISLTSTFIRGEGFSYLIGTLGLMLFFLGTRGLVTQTLSKVGIVLVLVAAIVWAVVMVRQLIVRRRT
jgi:hypothetical protein